MILDDKPQYKLSSFEISQLISLLEAYGAVLMKTQSSPLWQIEMQSVQTNIKMLRDKLQDVSIGDSYGMYKAIPDEGIEDALPDDEQIMKDMIAFGSHWVSDGKLYILTLDGWEEVTD